MTVFSWEKVYNKNMKNICLEPSYDYFKSIYDKNYLQGDFETFIIDYIFKTLENISFSRAFICLNSHLKEKMSERLTSLKLNVLIYEKGKIEKDDLLIDLTFLEDFQKYEDLFLHHQGKIIGFFIPSNLDSSNGFKTRDFVISEFFTCFNLPFGCLYQDGLDLIEKINSDNKIIKEENIGLVEEKDLKHQIKLPSNSINKGKRPYVSIIGGSKKYPGSVELSYLSLASFASGAGFCELIVMESLYSDYVLKNPQAIISTIKDDGKTIKFDKEKLEDIMSKSTSIVIGMGLGVNEEVYQTIEYLVKNYRGLLVIDADGLNVVSKYNKDLFLENVSQLIITPHIGEFARLNSCSIEDILNNPIKYGRDYQEKYHVTINLKSATTLIFETNKLIVSSFGNQSLAKAGSGDMLSGIIAGLSAYVQKKATLLEISNYILGTSSKLALHKKSSLSLTYLDIIENIGMVMKKLIDEED